MSNNEFATAVETETNDAKEVEIKCIGEVVSHAYESKATVSQEEQDKQLVRFFGDLKSKSERKVRRYQEQIWSTNKESIAHHCIGPLAASEEEMEAFLIVGINSEAAYALKATNAAAADAIKAYKEAHKAQENYALSRYLSHAAKSVASKKQAKTKLDWVRSLMRQDESFKAVLSHHERVFKKLINTLPDTPAKDARIMVEDRPGNEPPAISTTDAAFVSSPSVEKKKENCATFELWQTSGGLHRKAWVSRGDSHSFSIKAGFGVPLVTIGEELVVVLIAQSEAIIEACVFRINTRGTWSKNAQHCLSFTLDPKVFGTCGQLFSAHLHRDNHMYVCAIGKGAILFNANSPHKSTPVHVTMTAKDLKNDRVISAVSTAGKDLVFLATMTGECFGIDYTSGEVKVTEVTPAAEPIFSVTYSNLRTIMHTISAVCGTFNPYDYDGLRQIETPRPRDVQVCGSLLFTLDKYGSIYIFSTLSSGITFPFKAPKETPIGIEYPCLVAYQGLFVSPTVVAAVYANGVVQRFEIDTKMQKMIEDNALKTKQEMKRERKKEAKKAASKAKK